MAKAKPKKHAFPGKKSFLVLDVEILPVVAQFGRSAEISYPVEFAIIDSMKVGQSAAYPKEKLNVINAIRGRLTKIGKKKFIIRKINPTQGRIWRVADNAPAKGWSRVKKDKQNPDGTLKKGKWGGHRTKGQKVEETAAKTNGQ